MPVDIDHDPGVPKQSARDLKSLGIVAAKGDWKSGLLMLNALRQQWITTEVKATSHPAVTLIIASVHLFLIILRAMKDRERTYFVEAVELTTCTATGSVDEKVAQGVNLARSYRIPVTFKRQFSRQ